MWLIKNVAILRWIFVQFRRRDSKIKNKIAEVTNEYQDLIDEYGRIQRKESTLSKAKRDWVISRVVHLIDKGHIKVN